MGEITGVVLAAGAGRRAGGPKALRATASGELWLHLSVEFLRRSGCSTVLVVLGAAADSASALVPPSASVVVADDWEGGMSNSLRAGLRAAKGVAALLTLVDLPGLPASVGRRVVEGPVDRATLRRAVYGGRPGHPVLIGSDHWRAIISDASGDHGARDYLAAHDALEVECGDLSAGLDMDF